MIGKFALSATAAVALVFAASAAQAKTWHFTAKLDGASESPATTSKGTGEAKLSFDDATKKLTYEVDYKGLPGDVVAAHFHGPAEKGANGGVELPLTAGPSPMWITRWMSTASNENTPPGPTSRTTGAPPSTSVSSRTCP